MAIAYAKLYEIIHKKVKDEKEAEELYNAIVEIVKEGKLLVKNELKEELRNELSTKEDILLVEERLKKKIELLNQKIEITKKELEYKMIIQTLIILFAIIITNQNAIELIKLLFGFR
jgi:dTDP-glucose pyrophosphorylase